MKFDPVTIECTVLFEEIYKLAIFIEGECAKSLSESSETDLRRAIAQVLPNTFAVLHALKSLLSEGHLFGAELLLRPLLERVALISYLSKKKPESLKLWNDGWLHSKRPTIRYMIETITEPQIDLSKYGANETNLRRIFLELVDEMNSIVHPSPRTANRTAVSMDGGENYMLYSGANPQNHVYIEHISLTALGLVSALVQEIGIALPEINPQGQRA